MGREQRIAIDAMGGDFGPSALLPGLVLVRERTPGVCFLLYGDRERLDPIVEKDPVLKAACVVHHAPYAVGMDEKPAQALLRGRKTSSMWQALQAVKTGEAQGVVSAGNTGALMAMAKVVLGAMPSIERPALAALWPTLRGESIVLDVGATIGADASQLLDFAIMGASMARCLLRVSSPSVGFLNVGVEDMKGNEVVKEASKMLRSLALPLTAHGFVEGDGIGRGVCDVVVTEGFTGNIALKTAEGTAQQIATALKAVLSQTWFSKLGAFLARGAFLALKEKMDPKKSNGAVFLGLNGVVVKSHGGTDALGFAHAVDVALKMLEHDVMAQIAQGLAFKSSMGACDAEVLH